MDRRQFISKRFIPGTVTPILGRDNEVEDLIHLLELHQVVTITGTGGIGKTRLAIELCYRLSQEAFLDLIYLSMATLTEAKSLMPVLVDHLGITETNNRTLVAAVSEVLYDKHMLLVLDNLEHVTEASGEISQIISTCPGIRVLCTSRTPLKIEAEQEYCLQPLLMPSHLEATDLMKFPATMLFVDRAKKVNLDFAVTPENSKAIIEICQYLDGLPLAIELAASRLRVTTPGQLLTRLKKTINILASDSKDLPVRHRTLRNTINWSYHLLNESEKKLFRRLAVFNQGFSLEAIEKVCYETEVEALIPINEIESLIDKALVQKLDGNFQFSILQTIKDFAREKWVEAKEVDFISMKHAQFFHEISEQILEGTQGKEQYHRMQLGMVEEPNILLALDYLLEQARQDNGKAREMGFRICGNLWTFWHIHGKHVTAREYINSFFESDKEGLPSIGRCGALFCLHVACFTLGEIQISEEVARRLHDEAKALNNEEELAKGYFAMGFGNMFSSLEESLRYNRSAIQIFRKLKATYWLGLSLWQNGIFNLISGNEKDAKSSYSEALRIFRNLNEYEGIGIAQSGLCTLAFLAGDYDHALRLYADTLDAFKTIGDHPEEARILNEMSWTFIAKGDTFNALEYALKSVRAHQEIGSNRGIGLSLYAFAAIESIKGHYRKAIEIAAAAEHFASLKGVAIELGINNHGRIYLDNARMRLSASEVERSEQLGVNYSLKDILALVEDKTSIKPYEDSFIKKLEEAVEKHLSDCTFSVSELSDYVGMSQMQIYRKLKALKNESPSRFIRDYRLNKSKELLTSSDKTVAEIAYEVGFTDPNYFSRIFTKEFSQTPTEFRSH